MQLLDAINLMLPKLGEHPVTSLDDKHATIAIILPEIENELITLLLKGWWFNNYPYEATPDADGNITLGGDTLSFVSLRDPVAMRGARMFNSETLSYKWDCAVRGRITQRVEFNDLPECAAQYVWYSALVNVYISDLGMTQDVQAWQMRAGAAYTLVMAEHLRNKKYSTKQSPRFIRLHNALRT